VAEVRVTGREVPGGQLLEVILEVRDNGSLAIFPAMEARPKILVLVD
jgi:hypothetical protein